MENNLRHRKNEEIKDKLFIVRNIMNLIFILGAVVGLLFYFFWGRETGTFIILISMAFKFFECIFRFIK